MALLENQDIRLRALEPEDLDKLYQWENDTELWQYGSTLAPYSRFALRDYLANTLSQTLVESRQLRLMIVEKATNQTIGTIDLFDIDPINGRAGIGILLDKSYRRRGWALQSLQLMKEYAVRTLLLQQLYAYVPQTNVPSYRLFLKSGFVQSGMLQSWLKTADGLENVFLMQWLG
ncbi:MAG: GNAT family N-acetyltransferase [Candidatus Symbiothrix sp.]|jgi:diamine N-acetyltransferase|nr:GNAT family N-acetyltransferase [Candidatus Symbiothrix sp.]